MSCLLLVGSSSPETQKEIVSWSEQAKTFGGSSRRRGQCLRK